MRQEVKERIDQRILELYESRTVRDFPVQPVAVLYGMKNCRVMSYQAFAALNGCTVRDIIRAMNSADGFTIYEATKDWYIVAVNQDGRSRARVRWTLAHELGHITAGHFAELAKAGKAGASPSELAFMEEEANYFAASFLAPVAAIRALRAKSADDVRRWFDLSCQAAEYRWAEYRRSEGPDALDSFFRWYPVRSAVKTGERIYHTPDISADGFET